MQKCDYYDELGWLADILISRDQHDPGYVGRSWSTCGLWVGHIFQMGTKPLTVLEMVATITNIDGNVDDYHSGFQTLIPFE